MIRVDDLFARFGGEEFVITLYGATQAKAMEIAENMRATIQGHPFQFGNVDIPITVSMGVAEFQGKPTALTNSYNGQTRLSLSPRREGETESLPPPTKSKS